MTPQSVLIVEDSVTAATSLSLELQTQGVNDVAHVTTLAEAKEHLASHACDLVVLDLLLPDASGLDGLRAVRALAPDVAIVILTGTDDREIAMQALKEGAQDYLIKGEGGTLMLRTLSYALQRNNTLRTIETMSEQLREANAALKQANAQKDQYVGMVAHDLRSPLGVILGMSRLVRKQAADVLEPKHLGLLTRVCRTSEDMLRLVDDLLDLSSIESGELRLRPRPTNVSELIGEHLVMSQQLASAKDILIEFEVAEAPVRALIDPQRYEQVLANLLSNAVKYSPRGSTISLGLEPRDQSFVTTVRDRGQGIPADERAEMFKPFARTSTVPTEGEASTGLGLTIVRKIVEGHGGTIRVESEVGEGATFIVELPLVCEA